MQFYFFKFVLEDLKIELAALTKVIETPLYNCVHGNFSQLDFLNLMGWFCKINEK